jgi:trk system potassium uptake protein TrkH
MLARLFRLIAATWRQPVAGSALRGLRLRHPAQFVVLAFAMLILLGAGLLMLPIATPGPTSAPPLTALFTATGAACGALAVVDTATYWSRFGQLVVLGLIQLGGLGIMTLASLLGLLVFRGLGLRQRLATLTETGTLALGDLRRVLAGVAAFTLLFEAMTALLLSVRFGTAYGEPLGRAVWLGVFHAVSAFNNAGYTLYRDNLAGFVTDPWVTFTVAVAIIAGGTGFPVLLELRRRPWAPQRWSVHTKLTLLITTILLAIGSVAILVFEWANPATLGPLDVPGELLAGFFQAVTPRTAGFNTLDYGQLRETTWLVTDILMFIGAGSASTAGGIKVTTFALVALAIQAEARGDPTVNLFGRRIPDTAQRQALTVALLGLGAVVAGTLVLMVTDPLPLSRVLFEVCSAFGTVGNSTGITTELGPSGQQVLIALMFLGRVGPLTLGTALALRERQRLYRYPEERPLVG